MRIRGNESLLGRAAWSALALAIVWLAWKGEHVSVPAGALHIQSAVATAPDNTRPDPATDNFVSVAEMQASSCPAGSRIRDTRAIGGFGTSNNLPRPVAMSTGGQGLFLLAQPEVVMADTRGRGMRLALVNRTPDLLAFEALDSRLPIVQEAQDAAGNWRRIESQIGSDCGCSAHRVFLPRNCFWAFHVPRYKGPLATKLRFAMNLSGGLRLYSNVFDGSIHPAQFTLPAALNTHFLVDGYQQWRANHWKISSGMTKAAVTASAGTPARVLDAGETLPALGSTPERIVESETWVYFATFMNLHRFAVAFQDNAVSDIEHDQD